MIIDSHQHFWKYDPIEHQWIDDSMSVIRKDFLPSDLEPILKVNQVRGTVAVQAEQSEKETEFLLRLAESHSSIMGVVGWVDLCSVHAKESLSLFSRNPVFKGVRHIAQSEPDDYFLVKPEFQLGLSYLEEFDLSYDILIYPKQLPAAIELASNFPNQKFVIDHIAKPKINGKIDSMWKHHIEQLGRLNNVHCKISGLITEGNWNKWKAKDFVPYLDVVFRSFGSDRLLFGSDWPVCLIAGSYQKALHLVQDYIRNNCIEGFDKIMGQNAIEFYNL